MSQESASETSLSVREFIYLDTAKIQSYLSQIDNGLSLLVNSVNNEYNHTDVNDPVREVVNDYFIRGLAGGGVPFLGQLEGESSFQRTVKTSSGGKSVQTASSARRAETSILHHKMFDLVMDKLKEKLEIHQGYIYLIPVGTLGSMMEKYAKTMNASEMKNAKRGFQAISELGVTNVAYCEAEDKLVQAFMIAEFFTISPLVFPFTYGVPTESKFTLVGIKGKRKYAETDVAPRGLKNSTTANLTNALGGFNKVIDDMFSNQERVYPLALYKTL